MHVFSLIPLKQCRNIKSLALRFMRVFKLKQYFLLTTFPYPTNVLSNTMGHSTVPFLDFGVWQSWYLYWPYALKTITKAWSQGRSFRVRLKVHPPFSTRYPNQDSVSPTSNANRGGCGFLKCYFIFLLAL